MTDGIFLFSTTNLTTVNQIFNTSGTGQAIKGYIEKIVIASTSWTNGSLFISTVSDTEVILNKNDASGTLPITVYPRTIVASAISGTSLSGTGNGGYEKVYVDGPIQISGLGLGSSTAGTTGQVTVYYSNYG